MPTTTIAGTKARVLFGDPVSAPTTVAQARSWKFDIDTDLIENTQGYGGVVTPWKEYIQGALSWTGTIEGNLDMTSNLLFAGVLWNTSPSIPSVAAPMPLVLYPDFLGSTSRYYYGLVWPKLSVEARLLNVIRFTMDFTGHGALTGY